MSDFFWQKVEVLQAPVITDLQDYLDQANEFTHLYQKEKSFFSARYKACFIQKNDLICDAFYPPSRESKVQNKDLWAIAQSQVNRLGPRGRQKLADRLLNQNQCVDPAQISALAFKLEETLPEVASLNRVLSLYKKMYDCQEQGPLEERGLFRLGLLSLWQEDLSTAERAFADTIKVSSSNSIIARSHFWLSALKNLDGKKDNKDQSFAVWKQFPLSYHMTQKLNESNLDLHAHVMSLSERTPYQQSKNLEEINSKIAFTTALAQVAPPELIHRAFEFFDYSLLSQAEPQVQLYMIQLLAKHSSNQHLTFQAMVRLFNQYPEFKTHNNLKMFYPTPYKDLVQKLNSGTPRSLIYALMRQESSFNERTVSPVGAMGLMQIMPDTAKELKRSIKEEDLLKPDLNIPLGTRYLRALLREFNGDTHKALAAYNAGAGNTRKWIKRYPVENSLLFADLIPFDETREYVSTILRNEYWYSKLYPELEVSDTLAQVEPQEK